MPTPFDLSGLVDVHIHTSPDTRERYADDIQVAREAAAVGMRGIMIKCHWSLTADRATIAQRVLRDEGLTGTAIVGGLALNAPVGWLNPVAVEVALAMGAREIWMPTLDLAGPGKTRWPGGPMILDERGVVKEVVVQILDMVAQADVVLGTGHLPAKETAALVPLARQRGVRRILVTHPEAKFLRLPTGLLDDLAAEGAFFEFCYNDVMPVDGSPGVPLAEIASYVRRVGVERSVLSTDYGQAGHPPPVEGMREYLSRMLDIGFSMTETRRMAGDNPAELMGL